jgi:GT2 family glycosyltransferase
MTLETSTKTGTSVAVIIVSYNSSDYLSKCLEHVRAQTWQPDRVIVIDNNSTEQASLEQLKGLTAVELIRLSDNVGYGGAINRAVDKFRGIDFIATLNPDAFPDANWLESLMTAAALYPRCGSFASLTVKAKDRNKIDGAGDILHISGVPWRRFHNKLISESNLVNEPVFSACAGAALFRLTSFRQVGGFDESFFMYVEDIDLGFRLQLKGAPCRFVPEAVAEHIGSASTGINSPFSVYHGHRNLTAVYLKNMPTSLLVLTLPLHLIACLLTILILGCRGRLAAICKAKFDALKDTPTRLKQRSLISQTVPTKYIWQQLQKWPIR